MGHMLPSGGTFDAVAIDRWGEGIAASSSGILPSLNNQAGSDIPDRAPGDWWKMKNELSGVLMQD
jgi:hypothetical protein